MKSLIHTFQVVCLGHSILSTKSNGLTTVYESVAPYLTAIMKKTSLFNKSMNIMKYIICIWLLFISFLACAQVTPPSGGKGVDPVEEIINDTVVGKTYAVIVGISDYQDSGIPKLRFAHKDAEAFANFLRSEAGGKLGVDNIKIFLNQEATRGKFIMALDWLQEVAKENDKIIIYFSGHGDIDKKSESKPGYLLCWDVLPGHYMASGGLNLRDLQEMVSNYANINKAKVILITDACHSGALTGNSIGGSQTTNANLEKQFANEIKIMSCQPNEFSLEGEQWGGGRGAFSYYLINGLYGLANIDQDLFISLKEVGRYLEDNVPAQAAPVKQNPLVRGDITLNLSSVNPALVDSLKSGKITQMKMLSPALSKGFEDDVLSVLDNTTKQMYQDFNNALQEKVFLAPVSACADYYFMKLMQEPKLESLHSSMRRNYASALIDESQQVLNTWLKVSPDQSATSGEIEKKTKIPRKVFTQLLSTFPKYIEKTIELLGKGHYLYPTLMARKYFFEGYLFANSTQNPDKETGRKALQAFQNSLQWDFDQPLVYWQMSRVYGWNLLQADSMELMAKKAMEIYPNWVVPYTELGFILSYKFGLTDKAEPYIIKASQMDSTSVAVWNIWGVNDFRKKDFKAAEIKFRKALQLDPKNANGYNNLGTVLSRTERYKEAEEQYLKSLDLDPSNFSTIGNLGNVYLNTFRYTEAETQLLKSIALDSTLWQTYTNLALAYQRQQKWYESKTAIQKAIDQAPEKSLALLYGIQGNAFTHITSKFEQAMPTLQKSLKILSDSPDTYIYMSQWALKKNDIEQAWGCLEQGLEHDLSRGELKLNGLLNEPDFKVLQKTEKWNKLMKQYFPNQFAN